VPECGCSANLSGPRELVTQRNRGLGRKTLRFSQQWSNSTSETGEIQLQQLRLLALHEAANALSAATEAVIHESMALPKGHTTLIVVAHLISTAQRVDVACTRDEDRTSASGTLQEM